MLKHRLDMEKEAFFKEYLSVFGPDGICRCECGEQHRIIPGRILLREGALLDVAKMAGERLASGAGVWILSDGNTEEAAGSALKEHLGGIKVFDTILPSVPRPSPDMETIHRLTDAVRKVRPELIISVGGGTISDLGKKISGDTGIPNWCVPTSPSVDAFTSGNSAIWIDGAHHSLPVSASEVVAGDIGVLEKAPDRLFQAGFGDLIGKYLARLDWHMSSMLTGESYCPRTAEFALESARQALVAAGNFTADRRGAVFQLMDAVLTSGLVMQATGSSRPAASSEHNIAHFWTAAKAVRNDEYDLHGILTGVAGALTHRAYSEFFRRVSSLEVNIPERLAEVNRESVWDRELDPDILFYAGRMKDEMKEKASGREIVEEHLSRFNTHRDTILGMASLLLRELEEALGVLKAIGFPFSLTKLGLSRPQALLPFRYVRFLRNRYTAFDLMYETGLDEEIITYLESGGIEEFSS